MVIDGLSRTIWHLAEYVSIHRHHDKYEYNCSLLGIWFDRDVVELVPNIDQDYSYFVVYTRWRFYWEEPQTAEMLASTSITPHTCYLRDWPRRCSRWVGPWRPRSWTPTHRRARERGPYIYASSTDETTGSEHEGEVATTRRMKSTTTMSMTMNTDT